MAAKTIERFALRLTRLYEQGATEGRIGDYVRHWQRWVTGGLGTRQLDVVAWLQDQYHFLRQGTLLDATALGAGCPTARP